ncbi:MAG: crosslink repair DNA glycosylase YcaQ family protein [Woeseia sp.]
MRGRQLTIAEARRIALAAQGFDRPRPDGTPDIRHIRRAINELGLLQLDFVNVLVPAHYLVVYSRLGPYQRQRFDRLVYGRGEFTEQWAHEASIVPADCWPLLAHRRAAFRPYRNSPIRQLPDHHEYLQNALQIVRDKGPVTGRDLPPAPGPQRKAGDWHRSVQRSALEYHFGFGNVAVAGRLPNFQRQYDLPERVIDAAVHRREVPRDVAERALLLQAARACGIATLADLADYYRMTAADARERVAELVEAGQLIELSVEGWPMPAYLSADARLPRSVNCRALLSPFDPLIWYRPRAERLFDFHYRIEIYVPWHRRKWGYYVLPFLMDDRIVARVDLKADRAMGRLVVLSAHPEAGIDEARCAHELARELASLAHWLGLGTVSVGRKGKLARALAREVKLDA